jgi:hypothetical protein
VRLGWYALGDSQLGPVCLFGVLDQVLAYLLISEIGWFKIPFLLYYGLMWSVS